MLLIILPCPLLVILRFRASTPSVARGSPPNFRYLWFIENADRQSQCLSYLTFINTTRTTAICRKQSINGRMNTIKITINARYREREISKQGILEMLRAILSSMLIAQFLFRRFIISHQKNQEEMPITHPSVAVGGILFIHLWNGPFTIGATGVV